MAVRSGARAVEWSPWALCLALLALALAFTNRTVGWFLEIKAFFFLSFTALASLMALSRLATGFTPSRRFLAALTAWAALSALWSSAPEQSLVVALTMAGGGLFLLGLDAAIARDPAWRERFLALLRLLFAVELVVAVAQILGLSVALFGRGEEPIALLGNRNYLAHFLVLCLPAMFCPPRDETRGRGLLRRAFVVVGLFVLAVTACRGAWVALAVGATVAIALHRRVEFRRRPAMALLLAVVLAALGALALLPFARRFGPAKVASMRSRLLVWRLCAELLRERPALGHGAGRFGDVLARAHGRAFAGIEAGRLRAGWRHARNFRQAHCDALQLAVELGLVGLALATAVLLVGVSEFDGGRASGKAATVALASVVGGGLFSFPLHLGVTAPLALVWLALGRKSEGGRSPGRLGRTMAVHVALPLALLLLVFAFGRFQGELALARGLRLVNRGWWDGARRAFVVARQWAPWWGRPDLEEARCLVEEGRYAEGLAAFARGARLHYDHTVEVNRALAFEAAGRTKEAEGAFRLACALRPGAETFHQLGAFFEREGRWHDAEAWHRLALDASVFHYEAALALGRCLARQGRLREAVTRHQSNLQTLEGHWMSAGPEGFARGRILMYMEAALKELRALWRGAGRREEMEAVDRALKALSTGEWKGWTP